MKVALAAVVLIVALAMPLTGGASGTFQCGSRIMSFGASKSEVLYRCGSPTWTDSWEEERVERVFGFPRTGESYYYGTRIPLFTVVRVLIEEWTYNLGPNRFTRVLLFENNRLVRVDTGGYGY